MSMMKKEHFITLGLTIVGTMIGCYVSPKLMGMIGKKNTTVIVPPPVVEGEEVG